MKSKIFLQLARTAARKHVPRKISTIQLKYYLNLTDRVGTNHTMAAYWHLYSRFSMHYFERYTVLYRIEIDFEERERGSGPPPRLPRNRPARSGRACINMDDHFSYRMNSERDRLPNEGQVVHGGRGGGARGGGRVARERVGEEGRITTAVKYHETAVL